MGLVNAQINVFFGLIAMKKLLNGVVFLKNNTLVVSAGCMRLLTPFGHEREARFVRHAIMPNGICPDEWMVIREYFDNGFNIIFIITYGYIELNWFLSNKKQLQNVSLYPHNFIAYDWDQESHAAALLVSKGNPSNERKCELYNCTNYKNAPEYCKIFNGQIRNIALPLITRALLKRGESFRMKNVENVAMRRYNITQNFL